MMFSPSILYFALLLPLVDGHGQLLSPRSRNWLATVGEDGVNSQLAGRPSAEYCPHCLNVNDPDEGSCGSSPTKDYNQWLDSTGSPMPFIPQEVYTEGDIITVSSWMDTHHNGHIELRYCNLATNGGDFTPDCFVGNYLTFVEDVGVYGGYDGSGGVMNFLKMPADTNHPERGYLSAGQSVGSKHSFVMKFRLPMGLVGDKILLQWKYITANSCSPEGYNEYFASNDLPGSYWTSGLSTCTSPFNEDGTRSTTMPEQFFNCAEVSIVSASPTISPIPTIPPTTSAPTVSSKPTSETGTGCCTIDFKACSPTVEGWCSESEANCVGACMKWWLPSGAKSGCNARWDSCTNDWDCCSPGVCIKGYCDASSNPTPTSPTTSSPNRSPTTPNDGCCDWGNGCQPENEWCNDNQSNCEGPCNGTWKNASPTTPPPTLTQSPSRTPTTKSPSYVFEQRKCSDDAQLLSTVDALNKLNSLTYTVSVSPYTLSILAEGGAAGSGGSVVSEGQAYGLLAAALALVDMDGNDSSYADVMETFWGYYNGWRRMCENSLPYSTCQPTKYCNGFPCLPAWLHSGDLTTVKGTGAAPDGDVDAIVAMIIAVKILERSTDLSQEWQSRVDEIRDWADKSCTSFMNFNTVLSSSGNHRILKLGTCWGGWGSNGNNPSYHAPGHYRMMRDFQASINSGNQPSADDWDMLIDTSYKFLKIAQCPAGTGSGLVPNWALVQETADGSSLEARSGSFSGSGTPQYEFGAEASRTMWRVAFDALSYPDEAAAQAMSFLDPLNAKLVEGFDPTDYTYIFAENSLQACSPTVSNVFGSWYWNGFIYGPVLSTLVAYDRQDMIDEACRKVGDISQESYYSRSWKVLAAMTLNGAVTEAGKLFLEGGGVTSTSSTTSYETSSSSTTTQTTTSTTSSSTTGTTSTTKPTTPDFYCDWGNGYEQPSNAYCHGSQENCEGNCNGSWVASTSTTSSTTSTIYTPRPVTAQPITMQPITLPPASSQPVSQPPTSASPISESSNCLPRASTVKLESTTGQTIALYEVSVISAEGIDVATGGTATQSSTYRDQPFRAASIAIDGRTDTFSHTDDDGSPWWQVELTTQSDVESIKIRNRYCIDTNDSRGCLCRLSNAKVVLIDNHGAVVTEKTVGDTCGQLVIDVEFDAKYSCPTPSPTPSVDYPIVSQIKLQSLTGLPINIFELQAFSGNVNVAHSKAATQSSTLKSFLATYAIDGDPQSFSHTESSDNNSWWQVDFEGLHIIESVVIKNRWCRDESDPMNCLCRLSHAVVSLFDGNGFVTARNLGNACGKLELMLDFSDYSSGSSNCTLFLGNLSP